MQSSGYPDWVTSLAVWGGGSARTLVLSQQTPSWGEDGGCGLGPFTASHPCVARGRGDGKRRGCPGRCPCFCVHLPTTLTALRPRQEPC